MHSSWLKCIFKKLLIQQQMTRVFFCLIPSDQFHRVKSGSTVRSWKLPSAREEEGAAGLNHLIDKKCMMVTARKTYSLLLLRLLIRKWLKARQFPTFLPSKCITISCLQNTALSSIYSNGYSTGGGGLSVRYCISSSSLMPCPIHQSPF